MDLSSFEAVTFDCYGTLIDWEAGILAALRPILAAHGAEHSDRQVLETYARLESGIEAGDFLPYREVLRRVVAGLGAELGFEASVEELAALPRSLASWPPFPDTVEALARLSRRCRLGVLSNVDDDLFEDSRRALGVEFEWVVTAQQVGAYKPALEGFRVLLERLGLPRERVLHVAQSLFHDIGPARRLGLSTVWVNRRGKRPGAGATPPATARPDLEVPDLVSLARAVEAAA